MDKAIYIIKTLRDAKIRITKLREAMINILSTNKKPISVSELISILHDHNIESHKTSIYREIIFLKKQNIIQEIQLGENRKRYELNSKKHHHHIICTGCKKIEDVVLEKDLYKQEQKIMIQKKFKITSHSLEFFGICAGCNK